MNTSPFESLEREFFRIVKDALRPAASGPRPDAPGPAAGPESFAPPVDVYETPEETIVLVELPGVVPSGVEITAEGDVLTIRGVKGNEPPAQGPPTIRERRSGTFERRIPLRREVDLEAARAEGRDGLLTIRLPRPAARKPRTIPIQSG